MTDLLPCYCRDEELLVPYCQRHSPDPGESPIRPITREKIDLALTMAGHRAMREADERRNVTAREEEHPERFQLLRLCACPSCDGRGIVTHAPDGTAHRPPGARCTDCRGEGRTRQLVATCATPEAVGVALVTLGREGEWNECPIGVLDTLGEKGAKWIVRPWLPSARNVSDAGRLLRAQQA